MPSTNDWLCHLATCHISMLQSLQWPTLEVRRKFLKLILMFKILKDQIHIPTYNFQPVTTHTRGYQYHYAHLQCNCEAY